MKTEESDRLFKGYSEFLERCGHNVKLEKPKVCNFPNLEDLYSGTMFTIKVDSKKQFILAEMSIEKNGTISAQSLTEALFITFIQENYPLALDLARIKKNSLEDVEKVFSKYYGKGPFNPYYLLAGLQLHLTNGILVLGLGEKGEKKDLPSLYGHTHFVSREDLVFDFSKGHLGFYSVYSPIKRYLPSPSDVFQAIYHKKEFAIFWLNLEKADYDLIRHGETSRKKQIVQEIARRNAPYYEVAGIRYHWKTNEDVVIGPLIPKTIQIKHN